MNGSQIRHHRAVYALWLGMLLLPASPALIFDGLPFGHPLEVLAFLVFLVFLSSKVAKRRLRHWLSQRATSAVSLCLLVLLLLKLFSFFRFPIGDNFEVCLKSIYRPTNERCEKSFDYLFHSNDGVNAQGDISRVDNKVMFRNTLNDESSLLGASHSTWNLPFQNEFPRFGELWMDRLPFTALIGAVIHSDADGLIPVEFIGTLRAQVGANTLADEELHYRRLAFIPINRGLHELKVEYSFSDSQAQDVPDSAPPPRGPYAHLVLGAPVKAETPFKMNLHIRGYAGTTDSRDAIEQIVVRSENSDLATRQEPRPDVVSTFADEGFEGEGFQLSLAVETGLSDLKPMTVIVRLANGTERVIGLVSPPDISRSFSGPQVTNVSNLSLISGVDAWYASSDELQPLTATHRIGPSALAHLSMRLIDGFLLLSVSLLLLLVFPHRGQLRPWLGATSAALGIWLLTQLPQWLQDAPLVAIFSQPVVVATLLLFPLLWMQRRRDLPYLWYLALSSALVGSSAALTAFRDFTGLGKAPWWGFMIFRDRAMDWFVFQGYAYQILTQQSLRGGEGLYYFMPGARYVVFLSHILLGNNDVLIGMVVLSSFIGVTLWTVSRLLTLLDRTHLNFAFVLLFGIAAVSIACSQLSIQLAISSSSETFAWLMLLSASLLAFEKWGDQNSLLRGMILGLVVFLRPNYLLVSAGLLIGLLLTTHTWASAPKTLARFTSRTWSVLGFVMTASLALVHNVYYAESFVFFTNLADPAQTVFPPGEILKLITDGAIRNHVLNRFRDFFYWRLSGLGTFQTASWISQLLFAAVIWRTIRARQLTFGHLLLLATPFLYVISSAPFGIMTIPERQFTAATYAFLLSSLLIEATVRRKSVDVQHT